MDAATDSAVSPLHHDAWDHARQKSSINQLNTYLVVKVSISSRLKLILNQSPLVCSLFPAAAACTVIVLQESLFREIEWRADDFQRKGDRAIKDPVSLEVGLQQLDLTRLISWLICVWLIVNPGRRAHRVQNKRPFFVVAKEKMFVCYSSGWCREIGWSVHKKPNTREFFFLFCVENLPNKKARTLTWGDLSSRTYHWGDRQRRTILWWSYGTISKVFLVQPCCFCRRRK